MGKIYSEPEFPTGNCNLVASWHPDGGDQNSKTSCNISSKTPTGEVQTRTSSKWAISLRGLTGRKAKHMHWWVGPARIIDKISDNGTSLRIRYGNSTYERHVINMNRWKGIPKDPVPAAVDKTLRVGTIERIYF